MCLGEVSIEVVRGRTFGEGADGRDGLLPEHIPDRDGAEGVGDTRSLYARAADCWRTLRVSDLHQECRGASKSRWHAIRRM